jgi:hypothetical protein
MRWIDRVPGPLAMLLVAALCSASACSSDGDASSPGMRAIFLRWTVTPGMAVQLDSAESWNIFDVTFRQYDDVPFAELTHQQPNQNFHTGGNLTADRWIKRELPGLRAASALPSSFVEQGTPAPGVYFALIIDEFATCTGELTSSTCPQSIFVKQDTVQDAKAGATLEFISNELDRLAGLADAKANAGREDLGQLDTGPRGPDIGI